MPEFALRTKLEPPFGNHRLQKYGLILSFVFHSSGCSRISQFSRISRRWTFLKRPVFPNPMLALQRISVSFSADLPGDWRGFLMNFECSPFPSNKTREILRDLGHKVRDNKQPRGPHDQKKSISLEMFNLDRNFQSRSKISISTSRFPHEK